MLAKMLLMVVKMTYNKDYGDDDDDDDDNGNK